MDEKTLRIWGLAIGGGAIAVAAAIAMFSAGPRGPDAPPAQTFISQIAPSRPAAPHIAAPHVGAPRVSSGGTSAPGPAAALAAPTTATGADAEVSFIIRFKPTHPIGKAQALAARGKLDAAARMARKAEARREIKGLCFDRFTVGGAETVMRLCVNPPSTDRDRQAARWLERLRASTYVVYADANVTVNTEKKPR
jgi:hypothetical protein